MFRRHTFRLALLTIGALCLFSSYVARYGSMTYYCALLGLCHYDVCLSSWGILEC